MIRVTHGFILICARVRSLGSYKILRLADHAMITPTRIPRAFPSHKVWGRIRRGLDAALRRAARRTRARISAAKRARGLKCHVEARVTARCVTVYGATATATALIRGHAPRYALKRAFAGNGESCAACLPRDVTLPRLSGRAD